MKRITSHWSERVPQDTVSDKQYFEISKSSLCSFTFSKWHSSLNSTVIHIANERDNRDYMSKHLSHNDWVIRQFDANGLRSSYRNVILHASIIEGAVRNESNKDSFKQANESLRDAGIISPAEFNAFEKVREVRNKLIHESFKDGLDEDQILGLRDTLRKKILIAYTISEFMDSKVFNMYRIQRLPKIALKVPK